MNLVTNWTNRPETQGQSDSDETPKTKLETNTVIIDDTMMTSSLFEYLTYEFPEMMETDLERMFELVCDFEDGIIRSINGLCGPNLENGFIGGGEEDLMCYIQDRLIDEKWEEEEVSV